MCFQGWGGKYLILADILLCVLSPHQETLMRQLRLAIPGLTFRTNGTLNIMITFAHADTKENYKLLPFAQVEIFLHA